eukprot:Colp12_sorted_trinity150504_noHs@21336
MSLERYPSEQDSAIDVGAPFEDDHESETTRRRYSRLSREDMQQSLKYVFRGAMMRTVQLGAWEVKEDAVLGVGENGKILFFHDASRMERTLERFRFDPDQVQVLPRGKFLIPGFVDVHCHAPQYAFTGTGLDLPLLDWLNKYTFPTEARFKEIEYAKQIYNRSVRRHLSAGSTTCCYFASLHVPATRALVDIIEKAGQRAFVGKVNMDRNSPDFYIETTAESIKGTMEFITTVLEKANPLITPVLTPRFVPTCTSELMNELARISNMFSLPIQSHMSESKNEIQWVKDLHPDHDGYAFVYDGHGLLNERTIMAHCIHLDDEEIQLMKERRAGIAHCPNSNFTLKSGVMDVRRLLDVGIKVGLGTDVSGGYSPSMLDAMRQALIASRTHFFNDNDHHAISLSEAFYLATVGGSQVLGLDDTIGNFLPGKDFDALLVDANVDNTPIDIFDEDTTEDIISKFLMVGDDRNVSEIFVAGKKVQ